MLRACVARHLTRTPYCLPLTARYYYHSPGRAASYCALFTADPSLALTLTLLLLTWKSGIWMAADQLYERFHGA